jgi:hypothetical protein
MFTFLVQPWRMLELQPRSIGLGIGGPEGRRCQIFAVYTVKRDVTARPGKIFNREGIRGRAAFVSRYIYFAAPQFVSFFSLGGIDRSEKISLRATEFASNDLWNHVF